MKLLSLVAAAALMVAVPAFANQELAQKNGCLACHSVDKKIVGPAYKDVAKKYANDKGARQAVGQSEKRRQRRMGPGRRCRPTRRSRMQI